MVSRGGQRRLLGGHGDKAGLAGSSGLGQALQCLAGRVQMRYDKGTTRGPLHQGQQTHASEIQKARLEQGKPEGQLVGIPTQPIRSNTSVPTIPCYLHI